MLSHLDLRRIELKITIEKFFKVLLFILFQILIIYLFYYFQHSGDLKQQLLLQEIKSLSTKNISKIWITYGDNINSKQKICLTSPAQIKLLQQLLKNADEKRVGGHNGPVYEWVLTFSIENHIDMNFYCTVHAAYQWNKFALYLTKYGQERGYRNKPVRVPKLGKWLLENGPVNGWIKKWGKRENQGGEIRDVFK